MQNGQNLGQLLWGEVKTTYAFSAFLTPFVSNFRFAWYQQAEEGGCYDTLAERYGERIRCFTLTRTSICIEMHTKALQRIARH